MILGPIISLITFPGLIAKIILTNILDSVFKVKKTDKGESTYTLKQLTLKLFVQFTFLTLLSLIAFGILASTTTSTEFSSYSTIQSIFLWLGASFAIHSFPVLSEGKYAWKMANDNKGTNKMLWRIFSIILFVISILDYFWGSIVYAGILFLIVRSSV